MKIRFAVDGSGNRFYIDQTVDGQKYYCPICNEKLVLKKGKERAHHFAHNGNGHSCDSWNHDMSDWHINWQNRFPLDCQEVKKELGGKAHIADVLLEASKTVIEFQHSIMAPEEFDDRNQFYNALGYKVIWVFDVAQAYDNEDIEFEKNAWIWHHPLKALRNLEPSAFNLHQMNVEIYLQIETIGNENERVNEYLRHKKEHDFVNPISIEEGEYYKDHKDDKGYLIKVRSVSQKGFERFYTNANEWTVNEFVLQFADVVDVNLDIAKEELVDYLYHLYDKDHSSYYFGCPISDTSQCVSSTIDIPKSKYQEIRPCEICAFSGHHYGRATCSKRLTDFGIPEGVKIEKYKRNYYGQIIEITMSSEGKTFVQKLDAIPYKVKGETIFDLWAKHQPSIATFKNLKRGYYVRIVNDPNAQGEKYRGKCYGFISDNQYTFSKNRKDKKEVFYANNAEWIMVWKN